MDDTDKDELETCNGQCGYSPLCRRCELEKKKLKAKKDDPKDLE